MTSPPGPYWRAQRLAEVGHYDEAERVVREGLASSPGDGWLLTLLASVLRLRRDYAGALTAASAAVTAAPLLADAHLERAENLIVLVRAREAVEAASEAVRLTPSAASGHFVLARSLAAARSFDQARAAAAHGRALDPRSVEGLLTVADVERDAGNRAEALAAAHAALNLSPDNAYGRWLVAMLDAERLKVRRSMRALRDVARDNPARADVVSMTWPIRGVLSGLRRGLVLSAALVCVLLLVALWWTPAGFFARLVAIVVAVVMAGFAARVLIPAGRLPWRCLALLPRLMRRADLAGLTLTGVAIALLALFAAVDWWPLPVAALALTPLLWALSFVELLGAGLDDPGSRQAIHDWTDEIRAWWRTTKKDLREAWNEPRGKH
ncbi:hypothetical protein [Actinoplanes solisilvae]|uniref:hypothetical protein n=1 Tax=Actinoplanes solisilvae TaxID=2486853 RepID=UPI000FD8068C|nr:hypothetical protein [Actinoplanes solisilvae]